MKQLDLAISPREEKRPLPRGWRWVRLGEVCEVVTGNTPPKSSAHFYGGTIPWIKPDDLDRAIYVYDSSEYLSEDGSKLARILPVGSVLVSCIGKLGKVAIAGQPLATNQQINSLIPTNDIDSLYLFYVSKTLKPKLEKESSSTIVPIVNKSAFSALSIPLPPLSEQKRIAAILNEQMATVEQARAAAQTQLNAAKALPAAYLRAVFNSPEAQKWRWVRLGDLVTKIGSGVTPSGGQASYLKSGIPLIRSQNVHMNRFVKDGLAFISPEQDKQMEGSKVFSGDILLNITGASIGRVCVVPKGVCPANVNQHVSIVRGDGSFEPVFVSHFISTPDFQKHILDSQAGATRQALTKTLIEDFQIPLPSLPEQKRIAALLNEQIAVVERARADIEDQITTINALPATLLRRAFNGEL